MNISCELNKPKDLINWIESSSYGNLTVWNFYWCTQRSFLNHTNQIITEFRIVCRIQKHKIMSTKYPLNITFITIKLIRILIVNSTFYSVAYSELGLSNDFRWKSIQMIPIIWICRKMNISNKILSSGINCVLAKNNCYLIASMNCC